jgi:hypothetical protein
VLKVHSIHYIHRIYRQLLSDLLSKLLSPIPGSAHHAASAGSDS